jgi:hypothetical protein
MQPIDRVTFLRLRERISGSRDFCSGASWITADTSKPSKIGESLGDVSQVPVALKSQRWKVGDWMSAASAGSQAGLQKRAFKSEPSKQASKDGLANLPRRPP